MKEGWIIYLTCRTLVLHSAVVDVTVTPYRIALVNGRVMDSKILDYMPSIFYIVKLRLALGNIFDWTESILAQSFLVLPHSDDV